MKRAYVFPLMIIPVFSVTECIHGSPDEDDVRSVIINAEEKEHPNVAKELNLSSWHCKLMAHKQSHSCDVVYRATPDPKLKAVRSELIVKRVDGEWVLIKRF